MKTCPAVWSFASRMSVAVVLIAFATTASADDPIELPENLEIEWTFEVNAESQSSRDLDPDTDDGLSSIRPELILELEYEATDTLSFFTEMEFRRRFELDRGRDRSRQDNETEFNLVQLYALTRTPVDGLSFSFGRRELNDRREWLYDVDLDSIVARFERGAFQLEAAVGRERAVKENLLEPAEDNEDIDTFIVNASFEAIEDQVFGLFALYRDNQDEDDQSRIYLGARAHGEIGDTLDYWAQAAHLTGDDGPNRLRSFGVDMGATYRFAGDIQPSLTLGYAFGSGDPDPDDGTDRQFRQTGLHDNSYRFNGFEEFRYYGEALDPDLSNLHVLTVGAGIRPTERSSIDLTYHYYRQDKAVSGEVPGARVSAETTGDSRNIGHGLNLILAYYGFEDIRLRAKLGYFSPGNAFDARVEDAYFIETGFEIQF